MRNIFDQYTQNENRLTHALASVLHLDEALRAEFLKRFFSGISYPEVSCVFVSEQSYPGQSPLSEREAEQIGIPDMWLFDDESGWCSVVESKIASPLYGRQVERHVAAARKRGFETVVPVTISVRPPKDRLPVGTVQLQWRDIYSWLHSHSANGCWASLAAKYFEVLEVQMVENEQLTEGTLTTFTGFQFADPGDYSYAEAKRVIRLALNELRKDMKLVNATGMDPSLSGRKAITGRNDDFVWDYLRVIEARETTSHTSHLHLTLSVSRRDVEAMVTVPHKLDRGARRRLVELGFDGFRNMLCKIVANMQPILDQQPHAAPTLRMIQRRYPTQRSVPFVDGIMTVDIRTAIEGAAPVKKQPQWIKAAYSAFENKKSNLQMQVGMTFPFGRCHLMQTDNALQLISTGWSACRPFFELVYPDRQTHRS